jgi:hypothetical protein
MLALGGLMWHHVRHRLRATGATQTTEKRALKIQAQLTRALIIQVKLWLVIIQLKSNM